MVSDNTLTLVMQAASLLLVAFCIFLVSSLLASLIFVIHRNYVGYHANNFSDKNKHINNIWLAVHAMSAVFASVAVTLWLSIPQSSRLPFIFNHCHSNNCAMHIPSAIDSSLLYLLFVFFTISMLVVCFILLKAHKNKIKDRISLLLILSQSETTTFEGSSKVTLVNTSEPILLNVGLLTPRLLLSSKVIESLDIKDVKLLLAYEYGKAKQFENIKIKLLQFCCLFWPSSTRRVLIYNLRKNLHESAYQEVYQLLGSQQANISSAMLNNMTKDIREFIVKINIPEQPLSLCNNKQSTSTLTTSTYLIICLYFACLIVVTSNVTHVLFELIG